MNEKEKIREILKFSKKYDRPFEEKLDETINLIQKFIGDRSAVFWSGGKDSTILIHLILSIKKDVCVIFENSKIDFQETIEYVHSLRRLWDVKNFYELYPTYDPWNIPQNPDPEYYSCTYWLKIEPALRFIKEHQIHKLFFGDRGEEEIARVIKLNKGLVQKNIKFSNKLNYAILDIYPIGYWSDEDIEKYALINKIELNLLYSKGYSRVACIFCPSQLHNLKANHPLLFADLLEKTRTKELEDLKKYLKDYLGHEIVKKYKKRVFL